MERILGYDAVSDEDATKRVADLKAKYPEFDFEWRTHETRKQFVVKNVTPTMGQPLVDKMRRTAEGLDPQVQAADVNDPATTKGFVGGKTGPTGAGGGPPAPATGD